MNAEKTGNLIYEERCPDVSIMPNLAAALGIEVETLMNGEMPLTQDISGKQIKEYNFRQPDRYPRNMQRDI